MLQRIYLTKVTVAKQHNWFFAYTETYAKTICKIKLARQRSKRDLKQLFKQCIKIT